MALKGVAMKAHWSLPMQVALTPARGLSMGTRWKVKGPRGY